VRPAPAHRFRTNAIIKTIEKESLQGLAEQKLDNGEVTSRNQHYRLREAYEQFRTEAEQLLAASEADDTRELGSVEDGDLVSRGSGNPIGAGAASWCGSERADLSALVFPDVPW
jgi:hypothetical protein